MRKRERAKPQTLEGQFVSTEPQQVMLSNMAKIGWKMTNSANLGKFLLNFGKFSFKIGLNWPIFGYLASARFMFKSGVRNTSGRKRSRVFLSPCFENQCFALRWFSREQYKLTKVMKTTSWAHANLKALMQEHAS